MEMLNNIESQVVWLFHAIYNLFYALFLKFHLNYYNTLESGMQTICKQLDNWTLSDP